MLIQQQAECDSPMRDAALRIGLEGLLENLLRRLVPERMLVAHRAVEAPLRALVARCFEMNDAELLLGIVLLCKDGKRQGDCGGEGNGCGEYADVSGHGWRLQIKVLASDGRSIPAGSHKRDTGFLWEPCVTMPAEKAMPDRALTFGRYRLDPRDGLMSGA